MNKTFTLVSLLLSCTIAGCSTASVRDYNRGVASSDKFEMDGAACEMAAEEHSRHYIGTVNYWSAQKKMMDLCMRSKGYLK